MDAIAEAKVSLRRAAAAQRDAMAAQARQDAAAAIAERPFPVPIATGKVLSGFMPLGSEVNPLPLMQKLKDMGAQLALPVIAGRGSALIMRDWDFGAPLDRGQWGIREPKADARVLEPDILLVPLLAFDRSGHRIGYGAGYYDLTIAGLRARKTVVAVGLAYAAQEVAAVPVTPRDARLDLVLTERETIDLRGG